MSNSWNESYDGILRAKLGSQKLIIPSVRAAIYDKQGRLLFIERRGSGKWALPAGGMELNESIYECLQREVQEETGLVVEQATLISMYTGRPYHVTNRFGNEYQGFEFLFRVDEWTGSVEKETDETTNIGFFSMTELPLMEPGFYEKHHHEVFRDLAAFNGGPIIK